MVIGQKNQAGPLFGRVSVKTNASPTSDRTHPKTTTTLPILIKAFSWCCGSRVKPGKLTIQTGSWPGVSRYCWKPGNQANSSFVCRPKVTLQSRLAKWYPARVGYKLPPCSSGNRRTIWIWGLELTGQFLQQCGESHDFPNKSLTSISSKAWINSQIVEN